MSSASNTNGPSKAAVQELLTSLQSKSSLSSEEFDQNYSQIIAQCQKDGECKYDWIPVRHLLALRFQQVYEDFLKSDTSASSKNPSAAAGTSDPTSGYCKKCRDQIAAATASGSTDPTASIQCRHGASDEEPLTIQFQRMMHMLIAFYKPPFTFQRMCDLLLEPRRYSRSTSKFLLAFSKLVCGINCESSEEGFIQAINWSETKDATLGIAKSNVTTREEDEFLFAAARAGDSNLVEAAMTAAAWGGAATHAVLPPQHYRVGMSAAEMAQAEWKEKEARERLLVQANANKQNEEDDAAATESSSSAAPPASSSSQQQQQPSSSGAAPMEE